MTTIHGVTPLPTEHTHVYAFEINAHLDATGMGELVDTLNHAFDRHDGKINLLLRFNDVDAHTAFKSLNLGVVKLKLRSLRHIARYAVVGAPVAADTMVNILRHIVPVDTRTFAPGDEQAAWAFVNVPVNMA